MSFYPSSPAPLEAFFMYISIILIFLVFGFSIYINTQLKYNKSYIINRKLKRIYNKLGIQDIEALHEEK